MNSYNRGAGVLPIDNVCTGVNAMSIREMTENARAQLPQLMASITKANHPQVVLMDFVRADLYESLAKFNLAP